MSSSSLVRAFGVPKRIGLTESEPVPHFARLPGRLSRPRSAGGRDWRSCESRRRESRNLVPGWKLYRRTPRSGAGWATVGQGGHPICGCGFNETFQGLCADSKIDTEELIGAKLDFDVAGHYSRHDLMLSLLDP